MYVTPRGAVERSRLSGDGSHGRAKDRYGLMRRQTFWPTAPQEDDPPTCRYPWSDPDASNARQITASALDAEFGPIEVAFDLAVLFTRKSERNPGHQPSFSGVQ